MSQTGRKAIHGEPKRAGGINLPVHVWAEIERIAALGGVPKNTVMERAITEFLGLAPDSPKKGLQSPSGQDDASVAGRLRDA